MGAPRLRSLGIDVPPDPGEGFPEHRLYGLLEDSPNPHSAYNAWIRLLVSFERALERELSAAGAFGPFFGAALPDIVGHEDIWSRAQQALEPVQGRVRKS